MMMKIGDVRTIAKAQGIEAGTLSKAALIKAIQVEEGNFACFATADSGECSQADCRWRDDCFTAAQQGALS